GEGGQNPSRAGDIIPPISSSEYLSTRDNSTLYNIIAQGQPTIGMSPIGSEYGGPLSEDQINAVVAYIRSWETNPPVELPPEVQQIQTIELSGQQVYDQVCSQCHQIGQDALGPDLSNPDFQASTSDEQILDSIKNGHPSTAMIAFSGLLTESQQRR
ncbi:MAG: c-type cytochrome, partial [Anaerolineales bacterium]